MRSIPLNKCSEVVPSEIAIGYPGFTTLVLVMEFAILWGARPQVANVRSMQNKALSQPDMAYSDLLAKHSVRNQV